jgi:hypothetical protein
MLHVNVNVELVHVSVYHNFSWNKCMCFMKSHELVIYIHENQNARSVCSNRQARACAQGIHKI